MRQAGFAHLPFPDVPAEQMGAVFGRLPMLPREEANRVVVAEIFGRLDAQAAFPVVLQTMASWRPDVVVRDPCEFGALIAAARLGVPQVQVAIGVDGLMRTFADWADEPLRELEQRAELDQIWVAERCGPPTFTSVPATLDESADDRRGDGGAPVWRYRTANSVADEAFRRRGEIRPSAGLRLLRLGHRLPGALRRHLPAMLAVLADLPIRVLMTTGNGYDLTRLQPLPTNA